MFVCVRYVLNSEVLFMNLRVERAKLECLYIECPHILKDINT